MSSYLLLNCYMLDSDYNHTVDFKTQESQLNWFLDKIQYRLDDSMYQRKSELEIRVDKSVTDLQYVNYLLVINDDGTKYFYFVTNKEYVNEYTTTLSLQLDLIQTYLFLLKPNNFTTCLVERSHIHEWYTDSNGKYRPVLVNLTEDEGLDTGEYEVKSVTTLYDYNDKGSYIITSSEPLGVLNGETRYQNTSNTGGGGDTPSSLKYLDGYMDKNGLRMVKSFEGFASVPYDLGDGTLTTGYGCTSAYSTEAYNSLLPSCTEKQASIVLGEYAFNSYSMLIKSQLDEVGYNWGYMTQNLFNAMVSFAWNSGAYAMQYDWTDLWNSILNGDNITNPQNLLSIWSVTNIMEGSIYEEGLKKRRLIEGQIALGEYDYSNFVISNVTYGGTITENDGYGYIPLGYQ